MKDINYNLTPRPWKFVQHESGNDVQHGLAGYSVHHGFTEGIAYNICRLDNARLIAAAPDLLETLTALLQVVKEAGHSNTERGYETVDYLGELTLDGKYHVINGKGINMNFLANAEEAIAKATSGSADKS